MQKGLLTLAILLLLAACKPASGIVTSRDEAIRKGMYDPSAADVAMAEAQPTLVPVQREALTVKAAPSTESVRPTPPPKTEIKTPATKVKTTKALLNESEAYDIIADEEGSYVIAQMMWFAAAHQGIPYRSGGVTTDGFDCSGFVFYTFNKYGITLPHSSADMAQLGRKLDDYNQAQPGDLIFFSNSGRNRINHVGIVTEVTDDEVRFIHSSSQSGITISSTKEPYYKRTLTQINRVLE